MDKELKAKWVAALRSGEYKQIKGQLKNENGMCCLGVLRELIAPGSVDSCNDKGLMLTRELLESIGLRQYSDGKSLGASIYSEFNDNGVSFAEIADHIEAHL